MNRRPAALMPVTRARLAGYALLAILGAMQWARFVEGASAGRALLWVLAGTVTGALVLLAGRRPRWRVAAVVGGALLAVLVSGLRLRYLAPNHLDELADGVARGLEALGTVRLPYTGTEPWVLTTVELMGAAMCWLAAVLATWPTREAGGHTRVAALLVLVTMAASPIVALGAERPALLGLAIAVLVAAFLWLERLARRPGLGVIALGAAVVLAAVPLGGAADREEPWFDYKAFSERIAGGTPVSYAWDHEYGPIDWPRDGVELFRVESEEPRYYKTSILPTFEDDRWTDETSGWLGDSAVDDLPSGGLRREWLDSFRVALRQLETDNVVGAGTVLDVTDATREVEPDYLPGLWAVDGGKELAKGDSYRVRAYVPRPSTDQLATATVGADPRRAAYLSLDLDVRPDARVATPGYRAGVPAPDAFEVQFPSFGSPAEPVADYEQLGLAGAGGEALRASSYARTWRLAQRLRRRADSPHDYLLRVNAFLRSDRFVYAEDPDRPRPGVPALESFLFDSQRGYCQHFSGAMTVLLRMGGIPSRVVTGFSPGGQRSSDGDWVVRDTDAHSWVEAWFDGIGWVTFDPTPPGTPARSQVAAIDEVDVAGAGLSDARPERPADARPDRAPVEPLAGDGPEAGSGGGPSVWPWVLGVALLLLAALGFVRTQQTDDPVADLERALRRAGRRGAPSRTLRQLQQDVDLPGDPYLSALGAARYGSGPGPDARQRAAFRRSLGRRLGRAGRVRALWAVPPTLPRRPR